MNFNFAIYEKRKSGTWLPCSGLYCALLGGGFIYLNEKESKEKAWLRHFLDVLILKIAGVLPDKAKVTGICIAPEGKIKLKEIKIPSKKQIEDYILNLVQDINTVNTAEFLPVESVLELSKENLDELNYNKRYFNWIEEWVPWG